MAQGTGLGRVVPLSEQAQRVWVGRWGCCAGFGRDVALCIPLRQKFIHHGVRILPVCAAGCPTPTTTVEDTSPSCCISAAPPSAEAHSPTLPPHHKTGRRCSSVGAEERLLEFGQNLIREYEKGGGGSGEEKGRYNMIAHLYDSTDPVTGTSMSEEMLVSMCVTYIIAGTDTTGTTLSWLMWALASHPHVYDTLRAELIAAFPDPGAFPDLASLRKLLYLTA
ncbi:cytochrome P450, partial [Punctularia strigosozonata HHB-11173 SS5]|uniref:cytochrome P450 n=1 Tax=Punctularia strigosozonata (strain HHB-11173) TaxID=741275 RepID=UPI0004417EC9